jgi:hypothetical protein
MPNRQLSGSGPLLIDTPAAIAPIGINNEKKMTPPNSPDYSATRWRDRPPCGLMSFIRKS